jgi:hypothetical protein
MNSAMKTTTFKTLVLAFLMLPTLVLANDKPQKSEKRKTIEKTFTVNKDALVDLKNKFGDMDISTWDKNEVSLFVEVIVKGNNENKVMDALERIDVDIESSNARVYAHTQFNNAKKNWSNNLNFEINYTVKMPKSASLVAENDYGALLIGDLDGKATLDCDYGKLIAGNLNHPDSSIEVDYTNNSEVAYFAGKVVDADYSDIIFDRAEDVDLNADYTKVAFEQIKTLHYDMDYGSLQIGKGGRIIGNSDYTNVKISYLISGIEFESDYGSLKITELDAKFEKVQLDGSYTNMKIGVSKDANFSFQIDLRYADFDYDESMNYTFTRKIKDGSKRYYEGSVGTGGGKITAKGSYGGVDLDY